MPMVRAMRLMNSIQAGTTTGAQLQAQLTNGGVQSDFNSIMQLPGQCSVLAASLTAITAINLSPIAIGLTAGNPIPNLAMSRNAIARNFIISSARNLLTALVVAAPQNWYPYATWTSAFGANLNNLSRVATNASGYFVAFGNGTYVVTSGDSSRDVKTSPDGINWTVRTNALPAQAAGRWMGVAFGNGVFVAVSGGSAISNTAAYSTDGINWTATTLPNLAEWTNIACGLVGGTFTWIAISGGVNNSSSIAKSTDNGVTWVARNNLIASQRYAAIAYGNSTFVMVPGAFPFLSSQATSTGYRSTDGGDTWTGFGLHVNSNWIGVANSGANPNVWAAVNNFGQNISISSNNGVTWNDSSSGGGSNFIVGTSNGFLTNNLIFTGGSWTSLNSSINLNFTSSVSAINAQGFVRAVSQSSPFFVSFSQSSPTSTGFFYGFEFPFRVTSSLFANNQYYLFGYGGYYSSPDQQTWTWNTVPAFTAFGGPVSVAYNGTNTFVAVFGGANNAGATTLSAYSSDNGATWQFGNTMSGQNTLWTSVAFGNGRFVAVAGWPNRAISTSTASGNNSGVWSTNGISWNSSGLNGNQTYSHVTFANNLFVACAPSTSTPFYSSDGVSWTTGFTTSGQPRQAAFGRVGGQPYWLMTTSDGTNGYIMINIGELPTGSPQTFLLGSNAATVGTIYALSFANGYFFAATNGSGTNTVYSSNAPSSSATNWIATQLPATAINPSTFITSPGPIGVCYYPTTGPAPTVLGHANI